MLNMRFKDIISLCIIALLLSLLPVQVLAIEPEESAYEISAVQQLQMRMDMITNQYGITEEMSDREVAEIILAEDIDTLKVTMDEIDSINAEAQILTEDEFEALNKVTYGKICSVIQQLYSPMPIAEETIHSGKITITSNRGTATVEDDTTVKITYSISGMSWGTEYTFTIKNTCGKKATLQFDYSGSSFDDFYIEGTSPSSRSGTYGPVELENNGTVTLTAKSTCWNGQTDTLTLSNFVLKEAQDTSNVTFSFDSTGGSMTAGGTVVTTGTSQAVSLVDGVALSASANSGYTFLGWIDENGAIKSTTASFTFAPTADITITPVFASTSVTGVAWFQAGGQYLFTDLNKAGTTAAKLASKNVVLMNNATLPAGNYSIPAGVTLLIPFDAENTIYTTKPESAAYTPPVAYRTLRMAEGTHITVNGGLSVSAKVSMSFGTNGATTGNHGVIQMVEGSSITVNNGAGLYVYGFITGDGEVIANSGSVIYQCFSFRDWRGGSQTTSMKNKVFPLSQYYIQNIESLLYIYSGAKMYGYAYAEVSYVGTAGAAVPIIGDSALFRIASGYLTMKYDGNTDRNIYNIYGDVSLASTKIKISIYSIDSSEYVFGLNHNTSVNICNGSTVTLVEDMAIYPSTKFLIEEGGTLKLSSAVNFYIYDADNWGNYTYNNGPVRFTPVAYAPGRAAGVDRTSTLDNDACIQVDGILDASLGYLYTTCGINIASGTDITNWDGGGANICSTGAGQVMINLGSGKNTYQCEQGTSTVYYQIPITSAQLKNGDNSYVKTANVGAGTYKYIDGFWHISTCGGFEDEVIKEATCEEAGLINYKCSCNNTYDEDIAPNPNAHAVVIDEAKVPTCTESGLSEGSHCSVCGEVLVAQEEVPQLGHSIDTSTICTTDQVCAVCGETVKATGHSYEMTAAGTQCTVCKQIPIAEKGRTLSYEDYIYVVDIFELNGLDGIDLSSKAGVLIWTEDDTDFNPKNLSNIQYDADHAYQGLQVYDEELNYYYGVSYGIETPDLHKTMYLVGYVEIGEGEYVYSKVLTYSPVQYAYNMINSDTEAPETHNLCVALLNYITAAQKFFDPSTPETQYANAKLSDEDAALYSAKLTAEELAGLKLAPAVDENKKVSDPAVNVITGTGQNLQFADMIRLGALYRIEDKIVNEPSRSYTIFWTQSQFDSVKGTPTKDDAAKGLTSEMSKYTKNVETGEWVSLAPKIAAKDMADAVYYFMGVIETENGVSYSQVLSYTIEQYIFNMKDDDQMGEFAKRLYDYERAARTALLG